MAQQVFNQWLPVAKAQNEQGQEVYLPFAGIHMQTRNGNDEVIVGAGNMVWTGSMWVPVSTQNRLPVDAAVSGTVDVSDRADRQLGKVALTGQVEYKTLKRYSDFQQFNNDDVVTLISDLDMAGVIEWWVVHRQNFAVSIGSGVQYEAIFYHRPGETPEDHTLTYYQDLITDNVGNQQGFTNPVRSFGRYMTLRVRNRTGAGGYIRHIELVLVR